MDELYRLMKRLRLSDSVSRPEIVDRLSQMDHSMVSYRLILGLGDKVPGVEHYIDVLVKIGKPAVMDLIDIFISPDQDYQARKLAAKALNRMNDPEIMTELMEQMTGDFERLNQQTIHALIEFAYHFEIDLPRAGSSLKEYVSRIQEKGDRKKTMEARVSALQMYKRLADAVARAKEPMEGGLMLEGETFKGSIKPPKKPVGGVFRQRRLANG